MLPRSFLLPMVAMSHPAFFLTYTAVRGTLTGAFLGFLWNLIQSLRR